MEAKIYRQNEKDIPAFYGAISYWSNALGELHCHGKYDISEEELPQPLHHAYHDLFFEENIGSLRYLVETDKGFGIALINEYDECFANDCGLSMDELFQFAIQDAAAVAADPVFEKTEVLLGELMGFDESHELAVVFPADTPTEEFYAAATKLDSIVYEAARAVQKTPLVNQIESASTRAAASHVGFDHDSRDLAMEQ